MRKFHPSFPTRISPQRVAYDVQNGSARKGSKIEGVGLEPPVKSYFGHVSIGT